MTGSTPHRDPFDADAALVELRPRLADARSHRRRRVFTSSALSVAVLVAGFGLVTVPGDGDPDAVAVLASSEEALLLDGGGVSTTTAPVMAPTIETTTTEVPAPAPEVVPPPPAPDPVPAPAPATPTPAPAPPPPPAPTPPPAPPQPPAAVQHTVSYDGAGSMVVEQRGDSLTLISSSPAPGWTATPHIGSDYVKVEFSKDGVHRYLKVKVHDGQLKVDRWEHKDAPSCAPPVGTTTHAAPRGAGSITVTVTPEGKLTLDQVTATAGWTGNIEIENHDTAKVKFRMDDGSNKYAWVKVMLRDCTIKVETGQN